MGKETLFREDAWTKLDRHLWELEDQLFLKELRKVIKGKKS